MHKSGWICVQTATHFLQCKCIQELNYPKFGKCIHDFLKFAPNSFLVGLLVYNNKKITKWPRLRTVRHGK